VVTRVEPLAFGASAVRTLAGLLVVVISAHRGVRRPGDLTASWPTERPDSTADRRARSTGAHTWRHPCPARSTDISYEVRSASTDISCLQRLQLPLAYCPARCATVHRLHRSRRLSAECSARRCARANTSYIRLQSKSLSQSVSRAAADPGLSLVPASLSSAKPSNTSAKSCGRRHAPIARPANRDRGLTTIDLILDF
jgi:hypothetical protein